VDTLAAMELAGENPTASEFKNWISSMVGTLMAGMDCSFSVVSDMAMELDVVRETLRQKEVEVKVMKEAIRDQDSVVKEVAKAKDKVEIKASSTEMEDKLRISTTQFKVIDLDLGKKTEDRKEIVFWESLRFERRSETTMLVSSMSSSCTRMWPPSPGKLSKLRTRTISLPSFSLLCRTRQSAGSWRTS
jgi:hypothetical protein